MHERPNFPGTTSEFPDWLLALPMSIEEIETFDGVQRLVEVIRTAGR